MALDTTVGAALAEHSGRDAAHYNVGGFKSLTANLCRATKRGKSADSLWGVSREGNDEVLVVSLV